MGKDSQPERGRTVFYQLRKQLAHDPDKEAVYDGRRRLTYKQLLQEIEAAASGLLQLGIQEGDKIITALPNGSEFISIFLALTKIGAILIPCNPACREKEWDDIFSRITIQAVFCKSSDVNIRYFKKQQKADRLDHIICVRSRQAEHKELFSFDDLVKNGTKLSGCPCINTDGTETAVILFTSGTTGEPKGVMLSHNNLLFSAINIKNNLHCTRNDVFYVPVPVFHVFGLIPGILTSLFSGGKIVFSESFHADQSLRLLQKEQVTVHYGVPAMFILEMNHPDFKKIKPNQLRTGLIAGAPCPVEVVKKIRSDMHCNIIVSYGATETSGGVTFTDFNDDDDHRSRSVGRVTRETQIKIINKQRTEVPTNSVGELACRGAGVMKGYFQMPDHPAFDSNGWFFTGDLAKMDNRGYLYIVGRRKEMIIRGGYNVFPWELEMLYHAHPAVEEVCIIGLPDTVLGEVICAVIKIKSDYQMAVSAESLKNYLKNKVASYKVPDHIFFIDRFPLNGVGKIDKNALREECIHDLKGVLR
ncbi:class I adenylate-forming enzyme family protein [Sporolactobacillus sp. KGMB 08714]|uniref:class I adenylate-forming enzyme family protein n=1 Tax=Sporolactobacillus sp. KGMB 08714 TaxID=3064704 RepID=UPI002FBD495C